MDVIVGGVEGVILGDIRSTTLSRDMRRTDIGPISVTVGRRYRGNKDLTVSSWTRHETDVTQVLEPLIEQSENTKLQPVYVVSDEYNGHINGFYWLQNVERDTYSGSHFVEEFTFELVYVGNNDSHQRGYVLRSLRSVSNDWGI